MVSTGSAVVVVATGEVDLTTAPRLHEAIEHARAQYTGDLVIDLSRIEFLDSTGLNVLLTAAGSASAPLRLVPSYAVRRPLEATGLTTVFELYDSLDDAMAAGQA
ncbi:STAS domain-containing protein [Nocardia sp. NPDC058058]|uniref:STAS domain-containing protein n=1 Tax=Nocardia sp. NPDC058058 TaxID=3346317 RepID=UPI0036DA436D